MHLSNSICSMGCRWTYMVIWCYLNGIGENFLHQIHVVPTEFQSIAISQMFDSFWPWFGLPNSNKISVFFFSGAIYKLKHGKRSSLQFVVCICVCMQVHPFHIQIAIGHHDFSKSRCLYLFKSPSFPSMFGAKMCSTCHGPAIPSRPGPAPMASLRPPPSALGPWPPRCGGAWRRRRRRRWRWRCAARCWQIWWKTNGQDATLGRGRS